MNTLPPNTIEQYAQKHGTPNYAYRSPEQTPEQFAEHVAEQLLTPALTPYLREATIEFAQEYGVYPPIIAIAHDTTASHRLRDLMDKHSQRIGRTRNTDPLVIHHDLIISRLNNNTPLQDIAEELNCTTASLKAHCRRHNLIP